MCHRIGQIVLVVLRHCESHLLSLRQGDTPRLEEYLKTCIYRKVILETLKN